MISKGWQIRNATLERHIGSEGNVDSSDEKVVKGRGTPVKEKVSIEEGNEVNNAILESLKRRREFAERQIALSEARLKFDQERDLFDRESFEKSHDVMEKRMKLEERIFEWHREERMDARRERENMLEVMGVMLNKLQ